MTRPAAGDAAWPTGQIIAEIRGMTGSRRHNIGVTYLETLTDILVHGQDIAIPVGRHHDMPPRAAASRRQQGAVHALATASARRTQG